MRVGILSDTHGYFHPDLEIFFRDVDFIVHAGDIGSVEVYRRCQALAPVIAVRGNIDGEEFWELPKVEHRTLCGLSIALMHNAGDLLHPSPWIRSVLERRTHVLISGHYHAPWATKYDAPFGTCLWLNPGAAGNAGNHAERTAYCLTYPSDLPRDDTWYDALKLEKIHLGPRTFHL